MIDVRDVRELQAAVLAFKRVPATVRKVVNDEMRAEFNPVWKGLVQAHTRGALETKVLNAGVRIKAGNPPALVAASSTRGIGEGKRIVPARHWAAFEFGAVRNAYSKYERVNRKSGGKHKVERRTMRALPARNPKGRVVYPAAANIIPRIASYWVQSITRAVYDAAEGRQS